MKSFAGKPLYPKKGRKTFINPGTAPIEGATAGHAKQNIAQLILDVGFDPEQVEVAHYAEHDDSGRFFFVLRYNDQTCEVEMPGLDLSQVRYLDKEQNIWDFPRLYVNDESWVWKFAIGHIKSSLGNGERLMTNDER